MIFLQKNYLRTYRSIKNIILDSKKHKNIKESLVSEILDISNNKGAIKKKNKNIHLKSFVNKNFAHYRWF